MFLKKNIQGFREMFHFPDQFRWHLSFHQEVPNIAVEGFHGVISFGVIPLATKYFFPFLCTYMQIYNTYNQISCLSKSKVLLSFPLWDLLSRLDKLVFKSPVFKLNLKLHILVSLFFLIHIP